MRRVLISLVILAAVLVLALPSLAQEQTVHVVQPGENLFRISLRYGTTIAAIQSANGIANPNLIFVGQQLIIPGDDGVPPVPTQPPGQPQPQPTATPVPPPTDGQLYVVVPGDTLSRIARRFNTTYQAIAAANGIVNPNLIFVGQRLTIPGTTPPGQQPPVVPTQPPTTGDPPPSNAPIGGFELGGHVEGFRFPAQMREAGMTWVKKQLRWNQGQGPEIAQGLIDQARNNGFKILLGVVGNPNELAANPTQYYQDFANFLAGVAQLNPDAIEVWNEPNIDAEWPAGQINGASYTQMLRAAYTAIKNANPNVLVISGAPAPTGAEGAFPGRVVNDDNFLRQMAGAGAAGFMDCVGLHYNEGVLPPTARSGDPRDSSNHYSRYYPTMVSLYSGVFPGKPLCFTELGYLSPDGFGPLPPGFAWAATTSVQEQAAWLASAVQLARQSGNVRLMIVWNVDFTSYGTDPQAGYAIVRPDGTCPSCATLGAAMN
jgi:LysM repeat protein